MLVSALVQVRELIASMIRLPSDPGTRWHTLSHVLEAEPEVRYQQKLNLRCPVVVAKDESDDAVGHPSTSGEVGGGGEDGGSGDGGEAGYGGWSRRSSASTRARRSASLCVGQVELMMFEPG